MPHPPTRPAVPAPLAALAAGLLLLTTACGTSGQDGASDPGATTTDLARTDPAVDELTARKGPCPGRLPGDGDAASGGSDPAPGAPDLPEPDRAWVCVYQPSDRARGPAWAREARPRPVDTGRLPTLAAALSGLAPADPGRLCTKELGPRYLLVLATDGEAGADLTGVAVDGFGCRDVRLTDDPFATPPGEASGEASGAGVVPGVLTAPDDLVQLLAPGGLAGGR